MAVRIALLRGVNVSGTGKLPMAEFRAMLERLGLERVRTYIQSGNAVFDSPLSSAALEDMIRDGVAANFGFAPETFVRTPQEIVEALADHPFAGADLARVHVFFLRQTPELEPTALHALALPGDGWQVGHCRVTLHTPGGIGRSRLAARLDRLLPGPMTARNLRTLAALLQMVDARG